MNTAQLGKTVLTAATAAIALGGLVGCVAGGGSDIAFERFERFSSIPQDGAVTLVGATQSASYRADIRTNSVIPGPVVADETSTVDLVFRNASVSRIQVNAGDASVTFNATRGDTIEHVGTIVAADDRTGQDGLTMADPDRSGFDYQSFGSWITGYGTGSGSFGVGTFGTRTDPSMPSPVSAVHYAGGVEGFFQDGDDQVAFLYTADLTVDIDFDAGTFVTATTSSHAGPLGPGSMQARPDLDLVGSGSLTGNRLSGTMTSADGSLSGALTGWTYGPGGEEVGWTFRLDGPPGAMLGSAGAVQAPDDR